MTATRLEQAKCLLDEAEALCVRATGHDLEKANVCLQAVIALVTPGDDPTPVRGQIARVRRLIEEAGRLRLGWERARASQEAGYTPVGAAAAAAASTIEVAG